jgi:hypothetical protein
MALGKDLFIGFFSVAGIFLAAESLRRSALAARTGVGPPLVERWNDPKAPIGDFWQNLRDRLAGKGRQQTVDT